MVCLSDLRPIRKHDWKTVARVSTKWIERNDITGTISALHAILVDENEDRIHVWMGETISNYYNQNLIEGNIYEFSNFMVKHFVPNEMHKCFNQDTQLIFTSSTKFTHIKDNSNRFPLHVMKFTELDAISSLNLQQEYFIDIIGIVHSVYPFKEDTHNNEQTSYIDFHLTNTISYVKVRFCNNFAAFFDLQLNQATDLPAIVAITSCKITESTCSNMSSVINMPPTRFFINPQIPIALNLRKRFWDMHGG